MTDVPARDAGVDAVALQLAEALETLRAIRNGEVDALVVSDAPEPQIFTLSSADRPYRMFVESMRDGAVTVSASGVVLYANERLAELLGQPVAEIVGAAITSFVPPEHQQALQAHVGGAGAAATIEIEICGRGQQLIWTRVGAATLHVDDEQMVCLTFADLSATRRNEAALALAHEQALAALRLRSRFVANMSHEIRTPLNGVIGMTELMLGTPLSEEQREYAEGVRASADSLMGVVDQILDFSKLDNGHLQLECAPFAPLTVLEEACSVVAATASSKGVELLSAVDGVLPTWVAGDSTKLRQVLTNLMMNAVKFTERGHVCTTLSAVAEGARWRLRFRVEDTGIGVSKEAITRIFDSFSQADSSTTRTYGGTGLGLAICKQLVELMDGQIGVQSTVGRGSCFEFSVVVDAAVSGPTADPPLAALRGRVLLADDNALSARLLLGLLGGWGLSCVPTGSGPEALRQLRAAPPGDGFDLALIDCDMPGMSGIELAQAVADACAGGRRLPVPVVLLMTSQHERDAARQVGVEWFVSKPVRQGRLYATVAQVLELSTAEGTRPLSTAEGTRPLSNAEGTRPLSTAEGTRPLSTAEGTRPLSTAEGTRPLSTTADSSAPTRERVLLVEDNSINQLVGSRMLEKRGYLVEVAPNGQAAVDMHRQAPYRAIFLDCHMPVLDGYQAAAEIRRREGEDEHVPIIAMTANMIKGDREKCLAAGMDDYLGKPFTGEALDEVIARTVESGSRGDQFGAAAPDDLTALVDPVALQDLCLGDEGARRDLVGLFIEQSWRLVGEIGHAVHAGHAGELYSAADRLKRTSANVGALQMSEVSERLSNGGRTAVLAEAQQLVMQLQDVTAATCRSLLDLCAGVPSRP